MQQNLEPYVDRLIEEKGFNEKGPDVLTQIKKDLIERIEDRIDAMIVSNIKPEMLADFEKVLEKNNNEEIEAFVRAQISDIDEKVAQELLSFKTIYLS